MGGAFSEAGALVPVEAMLAGTRRAVRPSGPPTDEIPMWSAPDGVDRVTAQAVVDLAIRAGVAMLATGAAAADVTATVRLLTQAYGLTSVHVDVTFTSITVSYHRGPEADPLTVMRVVTYRVQDYTRLERLRSLILELSRDPLPVEEARVRFDALISAPHPYRRWVVTVAGGFLAAGVAGLVGAGWFIIVVSFLTAAGVGRVLHWLGKLGVASFFQQLVGAAIPTAVATLLVVAQAKGMTFFGDISPSLVVAAGIVLLLAGLSVVGAAEDALSGYYVTAGARAFEVIVLTLGIAVGVASVLAIGQRLGYPIAISPRTILSDRFWVQIICAVIIAVSFAISAYATERGVLVAGLASGVGWVILAVLERAEIGPTTASAGAAMVIGLVSRLIARRAGISALAVTTAAIVPLLPGRMVYEGISQIVSQPSGVGIASGLPTLAGAFGMGLGLAAGVSAGNYFAGLILAKRRGDHVQRAAGTRLPEIPEKSSVQPELSDTGETPTVAKSALKYDSESDSESDYDSDSESASNPGEVSDSTSPPTAASGSDRSASTTD